MLISYILSGCTDCNSLDAAACNLDAILANYGKNAYQNISYLTNKPLPRSGVKRIMYYQEIINNLKWDQCFYSPFQFPDIVSRAGVIADGFVGIVKRKTLPIFTTTTTTSTTTTSTSSTTSTTSSTTTTTTTFAMRAIAYNATSICVDSFDVIPQVIVTFEGQSGQGNYSLVLTSANTGTFSIPASLTGTFIATVVGHSNDYITVGLYNVSNALVVPAFATSGDPFGQSDPFNVALVDHIIFTCSPSG